MMTELEALVGLNMVANIGGIRLGKLLDYCSCPQDIFHLSVAVLRQIAGVEESTALRVRAFNPSVLKKEFSQAQKQNIRIIVYTDAEYPAFLKQIPSFPIVLYVKGDILPQDSFSIAIVGSRHASMYGLTCAENFSRQLSQLGFTIISGMARGIDSYAHKGALKMRGRTIAVIGSGFNRVYPPENSPLAEAIAQSGAVISEFPMDTEPLRANFPRRNRIISGLSQGVLVVEAARNSGALITADFALEQGKEVFALPGKVDSNTSFGTNRLIKQGAQLVTGIEDILEALEFAGIFRQEKSKELPLPVNRLKRSFSLSQEELKVYNALSKEPVFFDDIVSSTTLRIPEVSHILCMLQMKRLITQLPGTHYVRIDGQEDSSTCNE